MVPRMLVWYQNIAVVSVIFCINSNNTYYISLYIFKQVFKIIALASWLLMFIFICIDKEIVWQFYGIILVLYVLVKELKIGKN